METQVNKLVKSEAMPRETNKTMGGLAGLEGLWGTRRKDLAGGSPIVLEARPQ